MTEQPGLSAVPGTGRRGRIASPVWEGGDDPKSPFRPASPRLAEQPRTSDFALRASGFLRISAFGFRISLLPLLFALAGLALAQPATRPLPAAPASEARVTERGPHHRVWIRLVAEPTPDGGTR